MRRFGIAILGLPTLRTVKLCQTAEEAGFDNAWIADESPSPPFRDATVTMTAVLLNTKKIKLGSSIFVPYTRHPALLSVFISTLNELGEGRVILGIGPGGSLTMRPLQLKMWDRPVTAMREAVSIVRRLLSGENLTFEGDVFKIKDTYLSALPKGKLPIYLAARGPKMLELAGEVADGCLLSVPGEYISLAKSFVKKGAEKAGRRIEDIEIVNLAIFYPSRDKEKAIESIRPNTIHMVTDSPDLVHKKLGIDLKTVESVRDALNGDRNKAVSMITDEMVEKLAIVGPPEKCTTKIEKQFKAGLNQIVLNTPRHLISEELIRATSEDIIRELRG